MAQPKTPPMSVRFGPETLKAIDDFAEANNLSRHGAIIHLVVNGLSGWTGLETARTLSLRKPTPAAQKQTVAPTVPLMERKPFNPQPKTGKKR